MFNEFRIKNNIVHNTLYILQKTIIIGLNFGVSLYYATLIKLGRTIQRKALGMGTASFFLFQKKDIVDSPLERPNHKIEYCLLNKQYKSYLV